MSLFYKRIISRNIARGILGDRETTDVKELERYLQKRIRVQTVHKDDISNKSQFVMDLQSLARGLRGNCLNLDKVQLEGEVDVQIDGDYIYFKSKPAHFTKRILESIYGDGANYGHQDNCGERTESVCVEFSSPNIAKPFHVGHMRSTIIGNVISNMYEAAGHDVKRINFLGDWGTQFGLLSLGLMRYTNIQQLKTDPLLELFHVYVKINQDVKSECGKASEMTSPTYQEAMALFTRLEQGDDNMKTVWKMVKDIGTVELDKIYQRLGVHFTHTLLESAYQDKTKEVLQSLLKAGLLQYDSKGVGFVQIANARNVGQASVVKSDGSSLYLTRDIASALDRQEQFSFERVHYVVDQGQRGHFIKLVGILDQLGVPWAKRPVDDIHIGFGRVKGMSTRQGKVVFLRDVLDEAKSRVSESMSSRSSTRVKENAETVADKLGAAAIILQDLKAFRGNNYTFSWDQMLSFKSDSGVFVQYCHARLSSLLSNCDVTLLSDTDPDAMVDPALYRVALHLARYPQVFEDSLSALEPHHIVQYLFRLCHLVNSAYAVCPVKGEATDVAKARLFLFACSRQVIRNSLLILGLKPMEEI